MRKMLLPLAAVVVASLATGCTAPHQKLGRGLSNCYEVVRWGELRRSVEQNAIEPLPGTGYFGVVHGFARSLERTGIGVYECATFVLPPYTPVFTKGSSFDSGFSPDPVFPDNFTPGLWSDALFDTDTYTGFGGGEVAPFIPGSRFSVF